MSDDEKKLSLNSYDFGDENADVALPDDPAFDEWISGVAGTVNVPPAAPRTEMWSEIASHVPKSPEVNPFRRSRLFLPAALAAALILGIGIDRMMRRPTEQMQILRSAQNDTTQANPAKLYRLAAQQTLSQAELLLTAYRGGDASSRDPETVRQLAQWGRQVLGSTRLLIDSPAGDDPRLKPLLEDLEVVLVQIIRLSGEPLDASERALIDGAITNRHLLPRIRSAVPAGTTGDAAAE